jgi:hypothetical protein
MLREFCSELSLLGIDEGWSNNNGLFMCWCSNNTGSILQRNTEARSVNHCWRRWVISITYTMCVFGALDVQRAVRMRHIVIRGTSGSAIFFFPHYLINGKIFWKKKYWTWNVFWFFSVSGTFLILRRIQRDIIINVHKCSCKVLLIVVRF